MTKYWVLGTGTWDATDKTHWSDQSGGMGGANVPIQSDDVVINNLSGGGTVTLGATGNCRSLDCTGFGGTFDMATQALNVGYTDGGAFVLAVNPMTFHSSLGAVINFVATSDNGGAGWDITTFGKFLPDLVFNGPGTPGGKWTVQDALNGITSAQRVTLLAGTLNTNGKQWRTGLFISTGAASRSLILVSSFGVSSAVEIQGASDIVWNVTPSLNLVAGTSSISCTGDAITFNGAGLAYWDLAISGGGVAKLSGSNSFHDLSRLPPPVFNAELSIDSPQTAAGTFTARPPVGDATHRFIVHSKTLGQSMKITAGAVSLLDVDFQDIEAAGATFSGTRLGNCLGNTGTFQFPPGETRYWVGGTGNWSDSAHWSTTSGGSGGADIPRPRTASSSTRCRSCRPPLSM